MLDPFDLPRFIEDIQQRPAERQSELAAGFMRLQEGSDELAYAIWPGEVRSHILKIDQATPEAYDELLQDLFIAAYPGDTVDDTQNN